MARKRETKDANRMKSNDSARTSAEAMNNKQKKRLSASCAEYANQIGGKQRKKE